MKNSSDQNENDPRGSIFSAAPTFKDDEEESKCKEIVLSLAEEQQEQAARASSYAYFKSSMLDDENDKPSANVRKKMALKMARRHLVARNGDVEKATDMMKNALVVLDQYKIDEIRLCFDKDAQVKLAERKDSIEKLSSIEKLQKIIHHEIMASPTMCIRGYDKSNQAILLRFPGQVEFASDEATFMIAQLYWTERALACTERKSKGRQEKVNMVVNYNGYTRKTKPPIHLIRKFVSVLQDCYPERLNLWIAIDPNIFLKTLWSIVSLFIEPRTKEKVKFVSGEEQKRKELKPYISEDQAVSFLLPEGKLTSPVDMKPYLVEAPFDHTYDECG